ncbi:MCP four helix bundle domain-containing protein [Flagellimonas abyssi]|uniref:MCP four helix bundle domain-containing protein n=1 Tax=Flagellimonas abyssi TaxID=2864871 RepID=A0ABS7EV95_9FLAO|nr:MCP four helix bundle domain-containing protein [Allomuricauda abyssi]MBW8201265.1 MCP four helix bundle domain-containing protein [Allomuricauda abyssi]
MKTKFSIKQRILVGLVLATAFLLVLGSNLLDRKYFSTIQASVKSIYDDRIVVQDYIYQLQDMAHEMEVALLKGEYVQGNERSEKIKALLAEFSRTKLTRDEARLLERLDRQFSDLEPSGTTNASKEGKPLAEAKVLPQLAQIRQTLDGLEEIQLEQSDMLTQLSEKTLGVNRMLSNLEVVFLVIIGISILVLAFYPVKVLNPVHWN